MNFEKYGNKLINLLTKLERYLEPEAQIGGGEGIISPSTETDSEYLKILSHSINHISILVHLDKNVQSNLEDPQISYNDIKIYSIEQQLRLGCDDIGNTYDFSMVLTFDFER